MDLLALAVVAAFVLAFGAVSGRIQSTWLTAPMVFAAFGLLIGEVGLGLVNIESTGEAVHLLAELTLVLVLFTDASRIDLAALRRDHDIPVRLLGIGLPLTMLLGAVAARWLLPGLPILEAAVLAIVLSPTDAALGQAVVSSPVVPVRIRQALNVESGLNDGIALPVLLFFASLAAGQVDGAHWLGFAASQILLGPLVGVVVGYCGGQLVEWGGRSRWMSEPFQNLAALGVSILAYAGAELVGGNGFIAAFAAGLTIGNASRAVCGCLYDFGEAEGQLLTLLTFMVYGAVMLPGALDHAAPAWLGYALLSLTVVRIVPVVLSLVGLRLQQDTLLFLGWFGPRGIASILYGMLVLERSGLPGAELIFGVTLTTVALSIVLHGLTAWPASRWYGARAEAMRDEEEEMPELESVTEMPVRLRLHSTS